ncbi:MAG: carbohydrate kinase [Gemmatimonadetes bacterium]|nr:carbohydrate kinase [Gemmatimonadota bacterium]
MPLPPLDGDADKNARGQVLVIGGSMRVPGAVLLAGVAALRAGAGKLQVATVRDAALPLGLAVPEALVVALPPTRAGEIAGSRAWPLLEPHASSADAVLVGPGMIGGESVAPIVAGLVRILGADATLVLDSASIFVLRDDEQMLMTLGGRAVVTPHAGEMATLLGIDKRDVEADAPAAAKHAAERFGVVVALKGAESWIASPNGSLLCYKDGSVGLATSGSGDTLAGIVAGLAARGAQATIAAAWAVWAHGTAGRRLARRLGTVGFLARELLAELPALVGRE